MVNQGRKEYLGHLQEPKLQVIQITNAQAELLNAYVKQGLKAKYQEWFTVIDLLDHMAKGFNHIWDQKYEEAILEFSMIDFLPFKKSDNPQVKSKLLLSPYLQSSL
jgi:hypothetical protein